MKMLYLLVSDNVRARIYNTTWPPGELTLVYHQLNFGGQLTDFAASLGRRLNADHRAEKFNCLTVMASSEFLTVLDMYLDAACRTSILGTCVLDAGHHTHKQLLARLSQMIAADRARHRKEVGSAFEKI